MFNTDAFMKHLYYDKNYGGENNGKYPVIGKVISSLFNDTTQPFVQRQLNVEIRRNRPFLIPGSADKKRHNFGFGSILDDCHYIGDYPLTDHDKQEINKSFPNFSFNSLGEYASLNRRTRNTHWETNDLVFFPSTTFRSGSTTQIFDPKTQFMKFVCENTKYKDYLDTNNGIFYFDSYKDLPGDLDECEKLFDKDVLEIKKLVNDIGRLQEITEYEQLNLALYDDSNIIEETFVQRFNKQIQLYGFISIPFAHAKKNHLITLKNLLPFRVNTDVEKQNISFELSYLEKEDDIVTNDKKIHNLSIVCVENKRPMPIIKKEVTIEALQAFDKYQKLNPIDIKITDSEVFKELTFISNRRIKYRFIPNTFLFSSSVQQETEVIFLTVTGLNEARDIFINGKSYKAIGCIYTNEIEGWDQIKKTTSNWVSCKLSNSKYPFGVKHLGFEFDTTRLKALIDFTLYLIDQNGNEIKMVFSSAKHTFFKFHNSNYFIMLKVKKTINSKQSTSEIDQWENEIKNSIKQMYIQSQNDSKLIEKYEKAFQTIKQEYALLYKENEELKKTIEQMKSNEKSLSENVGRKRSRLDYEDEYKNNENVQYIVRKKKKTPKIIYEDEEEETDSENDENNDEKRKIEETIVRKKSNKKNKKGISKVIKM